MNTTRPGAALVLAVVVVVVIQCVVAGTLHLAMQERRIADNGAGALRLRLAAEAALRAAPAFWHPGIDSMDVGDVARLHSGISPDGLALVAEALRVDTVLFMITGRATEAPPRFGRAAAAGLFLPPLLDTAALPAAALLAGGSIALQTGALASSDDLPACGRAAGPADALALPSLADLHARPGSTIDGTVAVGAPPAGTAARIAAIAAAAAVDTAADRVIARVGDLHVATAEYISGLLLIHGSLRIDVGAVIDGIIVVTGDADIAGAVHFAPCRALNAVRSAGLDRPRPHGHRPVVPAF